MSRVPTTLANFITTLSRSIYLRGPSITSLYRGLPLGTTEYPIVELICSPPTTGDSRYSTPERVRGAIALLASRGAPISRILTGDGGERRDTLLYRWVFGDNDGSVRPVGVDVLTIRIVCSPHIYERRTLNYSLYFHAGNYAATFDCVVVEEGRGVPTISRINFDPAAIVAMEELGQLYTYSGNCDPLPFEMLGHYGNPIVLDHRGLQVVVAHYTRMVVNRSYVKLAGLLVGIGLRLDWDGETNATSGSGELLGTPLNPYICRYSGTRERLELDLATRITSSGTRLEITTLETRWRGTKWAVSLHIGNPHLVVHNWESWKDKSGITNHGYFPVGICGEDALCLVVLGT